MARLDLYILAAIFLAAGISHFVFPRVFMRIMPQYLPWHRPLVIISGIAEILIAVALLLSTTRSLAAWSAIALLIAVFPANVEQLRRKKARMGLPLWLIILRLPLQFVLIYWAWIFT